MQFEFATASRILFGSGKARMIPRLAAGMGRRACVLTGKAAARTAPLLDGLKREGVDSVHFTVPSEPDTDLVRDGIAKAREADCDVVVGIGGGSVLDAGKVIAAFLTNRGELMDYLEVIGRGLPLLNRSAPYVAAPTTAGTGAEVTSNAVLFSPEQRVKVSMRSPYMLPTAAVVDPELTISMPPKVTASSGLDALTQLMEAFVSRAANPLTDGVCREGLRLAGRYLEAAYLDGNDLEAREGMAVSSLFGGIALANAKLGAVHGFAAPLGGLLRAPHGSVCARLLPFVMETNLAALKARDPGSPAVARYEEVARVLTGKPDADAEEGISWVRGLCERLKAPALSAMGLRAEEATLAVEKSKNSSSMKGNPIVLTDSELFGIVERAM